jgi:stage II sporulation protein GA (sporulation sigma-E factor processing peptidase)
MTVYLDVVWILNIIIDYMLLKLTAIVLKRSVKKWRMFLGTIIASFIVLLLFTPLSPIFYHPIGKFCYSALIVWTVFGYRRFSLFIQCLFMFYFVAFVIGGALFAIHFYIQSSEVYDHFHSFSTLGYGDPITWALVLFGFPLVWFFSKKRFDQIVVRKLKTDGLMAVEIKVFDIVIEAVGLIDTGNQLSDPTRQIPVIFVHGALAHDSIPKALLEEDAVTALSKGAMPDQWLNRVTIVPYRGVNGKSQFILAFRPDMVVIDHPEGRLQCQKVLIALTNHRLSEEDDFNCILHPDVVQLGSFASPAS